MSNTTRPTVVLNKQLRELRKLEDIKTATQLLDDAISGSEMQVDIVGALPSGENHIGSSGGNAVNPSDSFSRPANTTQYTSGDLIANSTTAGSVAPLTFLNAARVSSGSFTIMGARLHKDDADTTAAVFRLHLFKTDPVTNAPTNGDNGALELDSSGLSGGAYLGYFDFNMTGSPDIQSGAIELNAAPAEKNSITVKLLTGVDIYGILEARDTYTPASGETFNVELEILQD